MSLLVPDLYHLELVPPSPRTEFKTQQFLSGLAIFLGLLVAANSGGLLCTLPIVRKNGTRSVGMGTAPAGGGWGGARGSWRASLREWNSSMSRLNGSQLDQRQDRPGNTVQP